MRSAPVLFLGSKPLAMLFPVSIYLILLFDLINVPLLFSSVFDFVCVLVSFVFIFIILCVFCVPSWRQCPSLVAFFLCVSFCLLSLHFFSKLVQQYFG